MKVRPMRIAIVSIVLVLIFGAGWYLMYPSSGDPKNMKYVFWKVGIYKMDLDLATGTMIGDAHRNKLVLGKTEAQLRSRFGYLLTPTDASPYLRSCYENSSWKDRRVVFIRNSPWMVVLDGDKAVDLVLIKGC